MLGVAAGVASDSDGSRAAGEAGGSLTTAAASTAGVELNMLHSCYTCKTRFRQLHHFYADLCPACAELNWAKRQQVASLDGRVFLVTGARVKIGFQVCLKLLRCGATVLATSRFPADAAARFAAQADSAAWMGRLQCYGLDLRDLSSLERFCAHLIVRGQRLDGVINNACQTIRRPAAYYAHLLPAELEPERWTPHVRALLSDHQACFAPAPRAPPPQIRSCEGEAAAREAAGAGEASAAPASSSGVVAAPTEAAVSPAAVAAAAAASVPSALWSQAPLWSAEEGVMQPDSGEAANFPLGLRDVNGQQIDTRRSNSWLLKLHEVSTPEAAEVLAINTLAPFVINSRLRCLLEASPDAPRFVVNVSAMEGKFYRHKTANHPHTNMAKAALNMMTRTCADELAASAAVLMNSVDTGWINDEKPLERASAHRDAHHFQTPLDEVDAAARILDPVLSVVNGGPREAGKFLKDYRAIEW
jgi:NAD(P)-dependent dehydrogenase (short-subunit alcohol dehydrogenase family)